MLMHSRVKHSRECSPFVSSANQCLRRDPRHSKSVWQISRMPLPSTSTSQASSSLLPSLTTVSSSLLSHQWAQTQCGKVDFFRRLGFRSILDPRSLPNRLKRDIYKLDQTSPWKCFVIKSHLCHCRSCRRTSVRAEYRSQVHTSRSHRGIPRPSCRSASCRCRGLRCLHTRGVFEILKQIIIIPSHTVHHVLFIMAKGFCWWSK